MDITKQNAINLISLLTGNNYISEDSVIEVNDSVEGFSTIGDENTVFVISITGNITGSGMITGDLTALPADGSRELKRVVELSVGAGELNTGVAPIVSSIIDFGAEGNYQIVGWKYNV